MSRLHHKTHENGTKYYLLLFFIILRLNTQIIIYFISITGVKYINKGKVLSI